MTAGFGEGGPGRPARGLDAASLCLVLGAGLPVPERLEALAQRAAQVLADGLGDFALVALFEPGAEDVSHHATWHADRARITTLAETLGASAPRDLHDLAAVLADGVDVRALLAREAAAGGVYTSRYLRAGEPYLTRHGVRDAMLLVLTAADRTPLGLVICAREAASQPFSPHDEAACHAVLHQLGAMLAAARARARERAARERWQRASERRRQLLREILEAGRATREAIAGAVHDDVLQRLAAASLRLQTARLGEELEAAEADVVGRAAEVLWSATDELRLLLVEFTAGGASALPERIREIVAAAAPQHHLRLQGTLGPAPWEVEELVVRTVHELLASPGTGTSGQRQVGGAERVDLEAADELGTTLEVELTRDHESFRVSVRGLRQASAAVDSLSPTTRSYLGAIDARLEPAASARAPVVLVVPHRPEPAGLSLPAPSPRDAEDRRVLAPPAAPGSVASLVADVAAGLSAHEPLDERCLLAAARTLAKAFGDHAIIAVVGHDASADLVAVHHRLPDRTPALRAAVESVGAPGLRREAETLTPHGGGRVTLGAFEADAVAIRSGRDVLGIVACGRGAGPLAEHERTVLAAATEQVALAVATSRSRGSAEVYEQGHRHLASSRSALLPSLARADRAERDRVADRLGVTAMDEIDRAVAMLAGLRLEDHLVPASLSTAESIALGAQESLERLRVSLLPTGPAVGLEQAVREIVQEVLGEAPEIAVSVTGSRPEAPPPRVFHELTRAVREALTNVRRHAAATTVNVVLSPSPGPWRIVVTDNGVGMPAAPSTEPGHIGVRAMHRRLESIGGTSHILPRTGGGTVVSLSVPHGER